jgi:hypothetical protein
LSWHGWLAWLEASALGHALRSAGVWTYAVVNLVHILGIASLFGAVLLLDLRLMGWRRGIDLSAVVAISKPLAAAGLVLAIVSGSCLLAANATDYVDNPFLPIKLGAVVLGLLNIFIVSRVSAWKNIGLRPSTARERLQLATFGAASLLCWLVAIASGRMIGYW